MDKEEWWKRERYGCGGVKNGCGKDQKFRVLIVRVCGPGKSKTHQDQDRQRRVGLKKQIKDRSGKCESHTNGEVFSILERCSRSFCIRPRVLNGMAPGAGWGV
jgi:hypothetical protein